MLLLILFACLWTFTLAQNGRDEPNYFVFGGHVRWKNSEAPIKNFAPSLQIRLQSLSQKTPHQVFNVLPNGAYSVAVSSKGAYRLQLAAPQGWNFVPKDGYDVQVTGAAQNEEYVFFLTGFDVSGQVATAGLKTGPPNLYVSALAGTESLQSSVITQSKTTADGSFTLSSLSPGEYLVAVSDSKVISGPEDVRSSAKITVSTSSFRMPQPLVLQGHVLRSSVTFAGKGIAKIRILLYVSKGSTLTASDLEKFGCSKVPEKSSYPISSELASKVVQKPVCQTLTDSEGVFSFSRLAGGEYFLVAHHEASLTPELKSQRLLIEPPFLKAQMEHRDLLLEPGFAVTAFKLSGGRVHLSGVPVVGAKILLDGKTSAESDKTGSYELMISKPGKYKIEVELPKYQFPEVVVELSPMTDRLPEFSPSAVQLCGLFLFSTSSKIDQQDLPVVQFADGSRAIENAVASLSADRKSAKFCTYLPPGKHSVRLTKLSDFVRFSPTNLVVDVSAGPPKDLLFTQFQAKVEGEIFCAVNCKVADDQRLAVKLIPSDGRNADDLTYFAYVQVDSKNARHAVYSFDSVFPGTYEVQLILASVTEPSSTLPANNWCWAPAADQSQKTGQPRLITVVDRNLNMRSSPSLRFEQTGFRIHLEAPLLDAAGFDRAVDLTVAPLDDDRKASSKKPGDKVPVKPVSKMEPVHYTFTKPVSTICLPKEPQSVSLEAKTDCLRLSTPQPSIVHVTKDVPVSNPALSVQLQVSELPINVTVEVSTEFASLSEQSMPKLIVEAAVEKSGGPLNPTTQLPSTWEKHGEKYVAKSGLWVAPGDIVHLAVRPSPDSISAVYPLIVPATRTLQIPGPLILLGAHYEIEEVLPTARKARPTVLSTTDCPTALRSAFGDLSAVFVMQPGFFFTGSVVPPVDKVLVSVFADEELVSFTLPTESIDFSDFSDKADEALPALVTRTLTNASGVFKLGPVYFQEGGRSASPSSLLTVRLQKPGYEFSPKTDQADPRGHLWTFSARKLALVELKLADEGGQPLQNTLVTIVGSAYRGSETTGSSGVVRYVGLPPGEYYLQPMLKEYEFMIRRGKSVVSLMEHAVSVVEGGSISLELVGKRVAFSASGKVTSLSGFPEADVLVEAKMISKSEISGKQKVYPSPDAAPNVECSKQAGNAGFLLPLEQAVTGRDGQFKLRGLFPGCFYLVTVRGQSTQKGPDTLDDFTEQHPATGTQHTVPRSIILRMTTDDVSGLHFSLTPLVTMGTISATVDTPDLLLPGLSIVIHPASRPAQALVRHKFSVGSRLFFLSGKQLQPLIGGAYTIVLEANFNPGTRDQNTTVQKFDFSLQSTSSHHFSFTYRPNVDANSRV